MELAKGALVGGYVIEELLAQDQASVTYLAHHADGKKVEVTEYLPKKWAMRGDDGTLEPQSPEVKDVYEKGRTRFLEEAEALRKWFQDTGQPSHVAAVLAVPKERGTAYLITEHVEGSSLKETLDMDGPKTAAWVWRMLDRLSADLAAAHEAGVVHGAITPAHVRLRARAGGANEVLPVLVGFGVGVGRSAVAARMGQDDDVSKQMEGYAAIEQYETGEKEPRTDIYALGAVAYKALSDKTPPAASARGKGKSVEPLIAAAPALEDTGLAAAVMAALALDPAARPSDLAAWRVQLGLASPVSGENGAPEPPRPATDRWWKAAGVAAVAVLVVMVMVLATVFRQAQLADQERAQLATQFRQLETQFQQAAADRLAPGMVFRDCETCPLMTVLPAGTFMMGSDEGADDEQPRHQVMLEKPFAVGVTEVTFAEWNACVRANDGGCVEANDEGWGQGRKPVINVSWDDVQKYVTWLSGEAGHEYRLLTESEWEYAARAGTTTQWYWGNNESRWCDYANGGSDCDGVSSDLSSDGVPIGTAPVRSYRPNQFGLHDMSGNVSEWVEDCYIENYEDAPVDGSARTGFPDCRRRVLRGGAWSNSQRSLRSAWRHDRPTDLRLDDTGFRVARTLD